MAPNEPEHQRQQRRGWIPRPPESGSTADFIVALFAVVVAGSLFTLTTGLVVAAFFDNSNVAPFFAVLTDIMTTLIGSLIGYLAGKGQGRNDMEEKIQQLHEQRPQPPPVDEPPP
jgi:membrane protein DedA with SNARE-associated domain